MKFEEPEGKEPGPMLGDFDEMKEAKAFAHENLFKSDAVSTKKSPMI